MLAEGLRSGPFGPGGQRGERGERGEVVSLPRAYARTRARDEVQRNHLTILTILTRGLRRFPPGRGGRRARLVLATGLGKTIVFADLIGRLTSGVQEKPDGCEVTV